MREKIKSSKFISLSINTWDVIFPFEWWYLVREEEEEEMMVVDEMGLRDGWWWWLREEEEEDGWRERSGSSFTIQVRERGEEEKIAKKRKIWENQPILSHFIKESLERKREEINHSSKKEKRSEMKPIVRW